MIRKSQYTSDSPLDAVNESPWVRVGSSLAHHCDNDTRGSCGR